MSSLKKEKALYIRYDLQTHIMSPSLLLFSRSHNDAVCSMRLFVVVVVVFFFYIDVSRSSEISIIHLKEHVQDGCWYFYGICMNDAYECVKWFVAETSLLFYRSLPLSSSLCVSFLLPRQTISTVAINGEKKRVNVIYFDDIHSFLSEKSLRLFFIIIDIDIAHLST